LINRPVNQGGFLVKKFSTGFCIRLQKKLNNYSVAATVTALFLYPKSPRRGFIRLMVTFVTLFLKFYYIQRIAQNNVY